MESERYLLSTDRIRGIYEEETVREPFLSYFKKTAALLLLLREVVILKEENELCKLTIEELERLNHKLYADILPENYETSYANPSHTSELCKQAGIDNKYGQYLSFLHTEMRGLIPAAFEDDTDVITLYQELFIEFYNLFAYAQADAAKADAASINTTQTESQNQQPALPPLEEIKDCIYWFESDNCDILVPKRLDEQLDPGQDFALHLIMDSDLNDMRYLYCFGEYVTENERRTASFLNTLPQEQINAMASTYTEGYQIGFIKGNKDLSKKQVVNIRYCLGFERIVRAAVENFKEMGLKPTIYRAATLSLNKRGQHKIGYYGAIPNKQYEFDHKEDEALYLDRDFVNRKIGVLCTSFEERKELAAAHAGPAVIEIFGEAPFAPQAKAAVPSLDAKQQKLSVEYADLSGQITNQYIIGEERSFTIIAFPTPEIGPDYEQIFAETVKINTLDYKSYETMQQKLIDALDLAKMVQIKGKGKNETSLTVALYELKNPKTETIFENCVADVNIPVGEVFTSPKLSGTNGLLHVTEVYLDGLKYENLRLTFQDGKVAAYSCTNFATEEENAKYIKDNLLFHHETLPLGEFAIGTNTTAYRMARLYHIQEKLPVLIGEKTGPHFAIGDTCYSYEEDIKSYNPDGKEIVARENEVSALRKSSPKDAYFHCHTDITIPYDELGGIYAVHADGTKTALLEDGLFVLEGLEELNKPLKNL